MLTQVWVGINAADQREYAVFGRSTRLNDPTISIVLDRQVFENDGRGIVSVLPIPRCD